MAVFTIGRIGVNTASGGDGTSLQHPYSWQQQGRTVSLSGIHSAATDAAAVWLQQQILGLDPQNNPDEEWVPVTSATVSDLNGYFRVLSSSAVIPQGSLGTGTRLVEWSVQLERAPAWRQPNVELATVFGLLTNSWSVTDYRWVQALPDGSDMRWAIGLGRSLANTRATAYGTLRLAYGTSLITTNSSGLTVANHAPATHYSGGAYIEHPTSGHVVGRGDAQQADNWRVGNGLVRVTPGTSTFSLQFWDGSAWATAELFNFASVIGGVGNAASPRTVSVLVNSPHLCVLRANCKLEGALGATVDVSIRRGDRMARFYVTTGSAAGTLRAAFSTNRTCANITGGIRTNSSLNSRYYVVTSDIATTRDTTFGSLVTGSSVSKAAFAVGVSGTNSTTGDPEGALSIAEQSFGIYGETQRVVF